MLGSIPKNFQCEDVLKNISETIILANKDFEIIWLNDAAKTKLQPLFTLYNLDSADQAIGLHMNFFHSNPTNQQEIMKRLSSSYRTRITIKEQYVAETVISPIYISDTSTIEGYILMLLDVTKEENQKQKQTKLIDELSTPILKLWDGILVFPIVGSLNEERSKKLVEVALNRIIKDRAEHILLDLSSLNTMDEVSIHYLYQLVDTIRLVGSEAYLVGITPELTLSLINKGYKWKTFMEAGQALLHIIQTCSDSESIQEFIKLSAKRFISK
ncbi:STAS domain-containing protein [Bacillus coahuilensis]|uniref:STAS domain-containing protein n=1 Tax=Bacillus coahuilensis TaxID=408580 RepID=UPI0001850C3D|nr:STAS domain-containing protein [Bacillus coahuilensis]